MVLGAVWLATVVGFSTRDLSAQVGGSSIQGTVTDSTGAVIPGATITVTNMETNLQRTVPSSSAGLYVVPNIPPGRYRVQVSMAGFQTSVRENMDLVVGQQLVLNTALQLGEITQQVTVTGETPLVNTSTAQIAGLVAEREVRDLPLNGRSFDNLITLNPGTVNTTAMKRAASSSTGLGNYFSISGRRPGENIFRMNGIEYPGGSSGASSTPGGVSGQLLGIDAVREFNVLPMIDSAEYGHRGGGHISVVTSSGTNAFHGTVFEFHRNSALDARNFFDRGEIPPFKRNQFGGAAGGPILRDKTFIFGNYEGFRQRLGVSSVAIVPDAQARNGLLPDANGVYQPVPGFNPAVKPYFALWPDPTQPILDSRGLPTGTALSFSNPPQSIREEFGTARVDHTFSERDTLSGVYTIDDGILQTPQQNPLTQQRLVNRAQVVSLTEIHVFSPNVVNNFTVGFSRVNYFNNLPVPVMPPGVEPFVKSDLHGAGQIKIGGGTVAGSESITFAGSGPGTGSLQLLRTNIFNFQDQVSITRNIHTLSLGTWFQQIQPNARTLGYGQAVFSDLRSFLVGQQSSMVIAFVPFDDPWNSLMGAWFVQDAMRLTPNFTLNVGLRHEFTNGWNHRQGRAENFIQGPDGALLTEPIVGDDMFTENNAKWLLGPRVGLAWDPFGTGRTSIRAGFGMAYNLLDNIGWSIRGVQPEARELQIPNPPFPLVFTPGAPLPAGARGAAVQARGMQPDAQTPTVLNWRFEVEQGLGRTMSLRLAYVGSRGYHELQQASINNAVPVICPTAPCPTGLADGTKYFPAGLRRRNPNFANSTPAFMSAKNAYHSLQVDLNRRFGNGLAFRTNYTFSKSLDDSSSLSSFQAIGNPNQVMDPWDRQRDYGLSAFDVRNRFNFSGTYELPLGAGKAFLGGATGFADKLVSGWQLNGILSLQGGFPFTPQLGFNRSRDLNTANPDRPDMVPGRKIDDSIYVRKPEHWIDPSVFALPVAGTYGQVGRNVLIGPGLAEVDMSLFKSTQITERWRMQFRAEVFNLFNRVNFGIPGVVVLTPSGTPASSAGRITATGTTSREIQFGLKLIW
ncbi:MAG: hypothetical protein A3J28_12525 [Acidobacteria bacterium RIFCSPLOWO2_12_FULL_60_22]|nr:MAG: hypothetical protein A3J28_12525 [Acidobacteria bacterium RIFCSPLOWO2_12_FULL_60_22]